MRSSDFVAHLRELKATAILRTDDEARARAAMEAAVRGGFRIVEFTLNTPGALGLIAEFSARRDLVVGAGTVLEVRDAEAAVRAGAQFLVSPVFDPKVIEVAKKADIACIPGCFTPTEMFEAHRCGAPLQKLFPSPGNAANHIRACLGPMPFLRLVPTNGVDATNGAELLRAGAWALGINAAVFIADELKAGRFDRVEERARALLSSLG